MKYVNTIINVIYKLIVILFVEFTGLCNRCILYCMIDIDKLIGENLKRIRLAKGLTQDRLAEMVIIPKALISDTENNKRGIGKDIMSRICKALNIKPYEFYLEPDTPIIEDDLEKETLSTLREAKKFGIMVAEKIPEYGRFVIKEAKKSKTKKPDSL